MVNYRSWDHLTESQEQEWLEACISISGSDELFEKFRQDPQICYMTDNKHAGSVIPELNRAATVAPRVIGYISELSSRDQLGEPLEADVELVEGYKLSGSTAYSINMAAQLERVFGSLNGYNVAEIGAGYGNFANVLNVLHSINSYTAYDLFETSTLQKKYLDKQGWPVRYPSLGSPERDKYDLCFSCCSLSELKREERRFYADRVLTKSSRGFHVWNWKDRSFLFTYNEQYKLAVQRVLEELSDYMYPLVVKQDSYMLSTSFHTVFVWGQQ